MVLSGNEWYDIQDITDIFRGNYQFENPHHSHQTGNAELEFIIQYYYHARDIQKNIIIACYKCPNDLFTLSI